MTDSDLLRQFVTERSEAAFTQLVERRIHIVYAAALRQLAGDSHRAEDVTQDVFVALAQKAEALAKHPDLLGWLYTATHYSALKVIRSEERRRRREMEAQAMNEDDQHPISLTNWNRVRSVLDTAMHELNTRDRQIVLLHFFERHSFVDIAEMVGLSPNAAQKAAERAVDRLHAALSRRGISSTSAALAAGLASNVVGAAPPHLVASVASAALTNSVTSAGIIGIISAMKSAKIAFIGLGSLACLTIGVLLYERASLKVHSDVLEKQQHAMRTQTNTLKAQLVAAAANAKAAEDDNGMLLKAIADLKSGKNVTTPIPRSRDRASLSREQALTEVGAIVSKTEERARAKPNYRPYVEPNESMLSIDQKKSLAIARMSAKEKQQNVFIVFEKPGGTIFIPQFSNERIRKMYPQLTDADWSIFDLRYASAAAESEIADWPKTAATPTGK